MRSWVPSDRRAPAVGVDACLSAIHELALRLHRAFDQRAVLDQVVAWVAELGCGAAIAQKGPENTLCVAAHAGLTPRLLVSLRSLLRTPAEHTLPGYAALHRRVVLVEHLGRAEQFVDLRGLAPDETFQAALALPLIVDQDCLGVLMIYAAGDLDLDTIGLFEALTLQAALALHNATQVANLKARAERIEQRYAQLRRAYDLIAAERRTLATVLECASEAILVTDAQGIVQLGNRAVEATLDVHPDLLIGHALGKTQTLGALAALIERARAHGEQQEIVLAFPNDRTFHIGVAPVQSFDQPPQAYVIIFKDVTSFKQLEAMKNQFVATVSHDMKSPLNIIGSYAELLGLSGSLDEEQAEYIKRILASVRRLSALVSDLLDLARIESGAGLEPAPVDVEPIIRAAVEEQRLAADTKCIDLRAHHLSRTPLVWGDEGRLRQVVSNLLSNALTYTRPEGAIWLSTEADQDVVVVRVEDSGIGISPQDIPYIFDPFFRASAAKDISSDGTGLGLAIVKRIVEEHGGAVGVESAINGGSTFWFTLPIAPLDERRTTNDEGSAPTHSSFVLRPPSGHAPTNDERRTTNDERRR